jgi:phosphomannomutase
MTGYRFHPSVLRAYDIRGVVGETLSVSDARAIGQAFAKCMELAGLKTLCVGRDGRLTSPELEFALIDGLVSSGVHVWRVGTGPTPMVNFGVHHYSADAGIMVTGSHNPPDHNGFKLSLGGKPFFGDDLQKLGEIALNGDFLTVEGRVVERPAAKAYIARLLQNLEIANDVKVAWDPGNGSAGEIVSALTDKLPGKHHLINAHIDGTFPAHHPDPTVAENLEQLIKVVADESCDLGIAFDGDGDRIGIVDGKGRILWGDQIVALLARDVLSSAPGATIIADVKASDVLFDEVTRLGGKPLVWMSGHSLIKAKMVETGAPLAGEMSGHIFFADEYYGFDDAIYAALRMLRLLARTGQSLADLFDQLPRMVNTPELRFPCDDDRKFFVIDEVRERLNASGATVNTIDGVRVSTPDGWWLLRASNTQAVLVARCEAADKSALDRLKSEVAEQLRSSGIEPPAF